jgi:hypothetical protein
LSSCVHGSCFLVHGWLLASLSRSEPQQYL